MLVQGLKRSVLATMIVSVGLSGCASTGSSGSGQQSGTDPCNTGVAAIAGAVVGGLLTSGKDRVRGAALGAGVAALACVAWNYNVRQTKTAEQVQEEYKLANRGTLPAQSTISSYVTNVSSGAKVSPGGKMAVASNIVVVQGTSDSKPTVEEELTLVRPDGSEVKTRKKATSSGGAFATSYSMTMPEGVPQGEYPVRTALYLNGNRVSGKNMKVQVVSLPNGELVAMVAD